MAYKCGICREEKSGIKMVGSCSVCRINICIKCGTFKCPRCGKGITPFPRKAYNVVEGELTAKKITKAEQLQREAQVRKEGDKLAYIGIICGAIGLFIFWWLGLIAIIMGAGALSKKSYIGIAAIVLGIVDIIGFIIVIAML